MAHTSSGPELAARHTRVRTAKHRAPGKQPFLSFLRPRPAKVKVKHYEAPGPRRSASAWFFGVLFVLGFAGLALLALSSAAGGQLFAVRYIEFEGNARVSNRELQDEVRRHTAGGLLQVNLEAVRAALKQREWVREVEVARVWPDRLRVKISERAPFVLARRSNNALVWLDRDGTALGERGVFKLEPAPPVVSGLAEGPGAEVMETNRHHLLLYQGLLADLDRQEPKLSPRIDEVLFTEGPGVKLRLAGQKVLVLVGTQDFRARLQAALAVLEAVERRDADALKLFKITDAERLFSGKPIAYLNATLKDRVIVGLAE